MGRKYNTQCANSKHDEWRSNSNVFLNLKFIVGQKSVFYTAFEQKSRKLRDKFCTDCLIKCLNKRTYTSKLPTNFEALHSYRKLKENIVDYESSQSSQASNFGSQEFSVDVLHEEPQSADEIQQPLFEEATINGKTFCLVPKEMIKYLPTEGVHVEVLDGIGAVEVSNEFFYIPTSILPKLEKVITSSVDLQLEVKLLREQLWFSYGSSETIPPFEPEKIQEVCRTAGATKLFHAITTAMSQEHQTPFKKEQNEKKAVAIIYMLVYGQSQKANCFQKIFAQNMTGKGISESGLAILNQSGISFSKSTQRRDLIRTADSYESTVIKFIDEAIKKKCLLTLMIDDYTNVHTIRRPKDQV
ncbi:uncharacterized protein LOC135687658 [Rhopilema esculentum]|uniref:uncharacterized protein LOC135687658 n=1 Tax=Rhopilema esculentum TaxID=499914 RepID=UPI0031E19720